MKTTDTIIRELENEELVQNKPFAHFGWEGGEEFALYVFSDGYWESAKLILDTMIKNKNNFAIVDSLIYPLFFNYRHSIETFLKSLYFKFGDKSEEARKKYLEIGHDLANLWNVVKPYLNKGKKHLGSTIDFDAVEHYILSVNKFDPDSMMMRYPIEKSLYKNKDHDFKLDYINFGERMNELENALRQLDYELSNPMTEEASFDEQKEFYTIYEKYKEKIDEFMILLEKEACNEGIRTYNFTDILEILDAIKESEVLQFLQNCDSDLLILLDNLYYGGQAIDTHVVRLAKSPVPKQNEFIKLCYELMKQHGLKFGEKPDESNINIFGKSPSALYRNIKKAIEVIELQ